MRHWALGYSGQSLEQCGLFKVRSGKVRRADSAEEPEACSVGCWLTLLVAWGSGWKFCKEVERK